MYPTSTVSHRQLQAFDHLPMRGDGALPDIDIAVGVIAGDAETAGSQHLSYLRFGRVAQCFHDPGKIVHSMTDRIRSFAFGALATRIW